MADVEPSGARPPWAPPPWLRRLRAVAAEQRVTLDASMSPTERFNLACDLSTFALARLRDQASRRGCSLSALLLMYERADGRLRARG